MHTGILKSITFRFSFNHMFFADTILKMFATVLYHIVKHKFKDDRDEVNSTILSGFSHFQSSDTCSNACNSIIEHVQRLQFVKSIEFISGNHRVTLISQQSTSLGCFINCVQV